MPFFQGKLDDLEIEELGKENSHGFCWTWDQRLLCGSLHTAQLSKDSI